MKVVELPVKVVVPAGWNPNELSPEMRTRLRRSMERFGFVVPLVVRETSRGRYETVGGSHRLEVVREMGFESVSCVVVGVDDADAMLLSQCLNRLQGEDNIGLRAELVRRVLAERSTEEVLSLLPESAESLMALSSLGEDDLVASLQQWQAEQAAPKAPFKPVFEVATTRGGSDVVLMHDPQAEPRIADQPPPGGHGLEADSCSWWRRGRVELHLEHGINVLLSAA